jgi:trans-2,3-dihydro-3-hydroxyanthranilate isomerase
MRLELHLCDVFADRPLSGNTLPVVIHDGPLDGELMLRLTQELRQFETTFLQPTDEPDLFETHIYDLDRELDFAGHPLLGAAAILHDAYGNGDAERHWRLRVLGREVSVTTVPSTRPGCFEARMDQGVPQYLGVADEEQTRRAAAAFSLGVEDLAPGLPLEVLSTGLRYLVVPVASGLERARIVHPDLERLLDELGAEFAYVLDVEQRAGRHWQNDGSVEDVATGSAAGVVGAYLLRNGRAVAGERIALRQGHFLGRPSVLNIVPGERIEVSGPVTLLGRGTLRAEIASGSSPSRAAPEGSGSTARPTRT